MRSQPKVEASRGILPVTRWQVNRWRNAGRPLRFQLGQQTVRPLHEDSDSVQMLFFPSRAQLRWVAKSLAPCLKTTLPEIQTGWSANDLACGLGSIPSPLLHSSRHLPTMSVQILAPRRGTASVGGVQEESSDTDFGS